MIRGIERKREMRESKEFKTLAAKSSPRRSAWSFVKFESGGPCKKGETAAKTGCTPASGEGTKKESGETGDTQSKLDKLEKETRDSMRDMPTDHPDFDKTATKMQKIAEAKIVDKIKSGETQEAKAMAEEAGLEYREVLEDAEKAAKEGVDIMEDLLGFPKEDRAEIKSDKKKEEAAGEEEESAKDLLHKIEGVKEMFADKGWDVEEAEISESYDGQGFRVDIDGEEWSVYPDRNTADRVAVDSTKELLEEDPEGTMQNEQLRQFVSWSDTDARVHANDLADSDLEAAKDNGEIDEDDPDAEDKFISERYEEHYNGIKKDPREYFVEELGFYSDDEFFKQYPDSIDYQDAAEYIVRNDGAAATISGYDGEEVESGNSLWYRTN